MMARRRKLNKQQHLSPPWLTLKGSATYPQSKGVQPPSAHHTVLFPCGCKKILLMRIFHLVYAKFTSKEKEILEGKRLSQGQKAGSLWTSAMTANHSCLKAVMAFPSLRQPLMTPTVKKDRDTLPLSGGKTQINSQY